MTKLFLKTLFAFLLVGGIANAQTFAPSANANTKVQNSDAEVKKQPVADYKDSFTNAASSEDNSSEKGEFVNTVQKNFGDEKQEEEKKYNNSLGKVYQFRIENGKMVFDEERKILVYYENYKVERGMDNIVRCSMRIYVLNDLTERISSLALKLKWPEISTNVQMNRVNPGVRTYMDVMLLGEGCFSMDKTPTIEVNRCRVKGMSEDKCSDAIRWFKKNQ